MVIYMISLRSKITIKILNYYFLNPQASHYINELARLLGIDPKNADRTLKKLEQEGFFTSEFKGKERYFSLVPKSPLVKHFREVFLRTAGFEEQLRLALQQVDGVAQAYIFGSYAKNTMDAASDIDVFVVGSHSALAVRRAIHALQRASGREINVISMTGEELRREKRKKNPLVSRIFAEAHKKIL